LTITLSDAALTRLRDVAAERNTTPEAVAAAELEQADADAARLLGWAGAFASDVPDAAERHDHYLGEELARRKAGREDGA
jgi:hypothetical protein